MQGARRRGSHVGAVGRESAPFWKVVACRSRNLTRSLTVALESAAAAGKKVVIACDEIPGLILRGGHSWRIDDFCADPSAGCAVFCPWHTEIASRAGGHELSDFIKRELERVAERPTMQEWLERTQQAKPIAAKRNAAQIIRELRDNDDRSRCVGSGRTPHQRHSGRLDPK